MIRRVSLVGLLAALFLGLLYAVGQSVPAPDDPSEQPARIEASHTAELRSQHGKSSDDPKTVRLKQIGPDVWVSPAGLRYAGRDPQGRTRVEHVLRHARDIPERNGPHGVFDGGPERVFAVIDEGWRVAQRKHIRPEIERDRSTYLIPMGRRIGYLGGRTGAQRGHPPLSKLFLVIETKTKNVVTAFPR